MTSKNTATVTLDDEVTVNDVTYKSLTFRKMKGKDMCAGDLVSGDTRKGFAIFASMADVPITVIEELSADDVEKVGLACMPLMGKSAVVRQAQKALEKLGEQSTH